MNLQNQTNQLEQAIANLTRCNDCGLYFPPSRITYFAADDMSLCGKCEALQTMPDEPFLSDRELFRRYDELVDAFDDEPRGESPYQERIAIQLLELDEAHRQMWPRFPGYAASVAPEDSRLVEWWNGELGKWELAEVVESSNFHTHLDGRLHSHQPVTLRRWNHEITACHLGAIRMPHLEKRPIIPAVPDGSVTIVLEKQSHNGHVVERHSLPNGVATDYITRWERHFDADSRTRWQKWQIDELIIETHQAGPEYRHGEPIPAMPGDDNRWHYERSLDCPF